MTSGRNVLLNDILRLFNTVEMSDEASRHVSQFLFLVEFLAPRSPDDEGLASIATLWDECTPACRRDCEDL